MYRICRRGRISAQFVEHPRSFDFERGWDGCVVPEAREGIDEAVFDKEVHIERLNRQRRSDNVEAS